MRADSFITSPSWPVSVSWLPPDMRDASMKSTSPPTGVQARPMATPGSRVRSRISSSRCRGAPSSSSTSARVHDDGSARLLEPAPRELAADGADLALEVADARPRACSRG